MINALFVGVGGFFGAILRYLVANYIFTRTETLPFYFSTLTINVSGCFLIGMLSKIFEKQMNISPEIELFLMVGFLGAFTTYSTFSSDTINLFREQRVFLSILNITSHILFGLGGVLAGRYIIRMILK